MKHCSECGEEIQESARKCRFCGAWLTRRSHLAYLLNTVSLVSAVTALLISLTPIVIGSIEPDESKLVVLYTNYDSSRTHMDLYVENKGKKADGLIWVSIHTFPADDAIEKELLKLASSLGVPIKLENKDYDRFGRPSSSLIKPGEVVKTTVNLRGPSGGDLMLSFDSKEQLLRKLRQSKESNENDIVITGIYELRLVTVSAKEIRYKLYASRYK